MPEITETDRERALKLAEALDGAVGPATQLKIIERELAKLREELTAGQGAQFRARLECTRDPCPYCARPATAFGVNHPDGPFASEELARAYGQGMASNVYGASVHRVLIERRTVGLWEQVES